MIAVHSQGQQAGRLYQQRGNMQEWEITVINKGREIKERYRLPDNMNLGDLKTALKAENKTFTYARNLIPKNKRGIDESNIRV